MLLSCIVIDTVYEYYHVSLSQELTCLEQFFPSIVTVEIVPYCLMCISLVKLVLSFFLILLLVHILVNKDYHKSRVTYCCCNWLRK